MLREAPPFVRRRELAVCVTALLAVVFSTAPWLRMAPVHASVNEVSEAFALQLVAPEPELVPPQKLEEKPVLRTPAPSPRVADQQLVHTEAPSALPTTARPAPAQEATPAPAPQEVPARVPDLAPPAPPVTPVSNPNNERNYEAALKAFIESRKSYPAGRAAALERPEGTVHACMRLGRSGRPLDVVLKDSSGSALLDQAARRLLSGMNYPAFDESAFKGQEEHEFCLHLKYEAPRS